jgi:hypothetical protein
MAPALMERSEVPFLLGERAPVPFIGEGPPFACPRLLRRARGPRPRPSRSWQEGVAADRPPDNSTLGGRRVRMRHVAGEDVPQARRSVRGSRAHSAHVRRRTTARHGVHGAQARESAARRRVPTLLVSVYPGSTAFISKFLN